MDSDKSRLRDGVFARRNDEQEKVARQNRCKRIEALKISSFTTFRIADYCDEAERSFIEGCFRSCIICSAIAIELALKHTLIFQSKEEWEETYWWLEVGRVRFQTIINNLKCNKQLSNDAIWLRKVRNKIAVHPLYIGNVFDVKGNGVIEIKELEHYIWAFKAMLRDLRTLLQFIEPNKKRIIEEKKISKRDNDGKILEEYSVMDFLRQQKPIRYETWDFVNWRVIHNELIEEIAFEAYTRMVRTMNALFPVSRPQMEK